MSTEARPALIVQPSRPDLHSDREQPKELTDDDLTFLSNYTGRTDLDALRQHVYSVQRSTTDTVRYALDIIPIEEFATHLSNSTSGNCMERLQSSCESQLQSSAHLASLALADDGSLE